MDSVWAQDGALDPGVSFVSISEPRLSAKEVETILYKKSGLLGISGISSDMRELLARSEPEARLAVHYFVYRVAKEIGALAAVLGGIDDSCLQRALERIRRTFAANLPGLFMVGRGTRRNSQLSERSADLHSAKQSLVLGDSDKRGSDDRAAYRRAAGVDMSVPELWQVDVQPNSMTKRK